MNILKKVAIIIEIFILTIIISLLWAFISYKNFHYYQFVQPDFPLENQYSSLDTYDVSYIEFSSNDDVSKKHEI